MTIRVRHPGAVSRSSSLPNPRLRGARVERFPSSPIARFSPKLRAKPSLKYPRPARHDSCARQTDRAHPGFGSFSLWRWPSGSGRLEHGLAGVVASWLGFAARTAHEADTFADHHALRIAPGCLAGRAEAGGPQGHTQRGGAGPPCKQRSKPSAPGPSRPCPRCARPSTNWGWRWGTSLICRNNGCCTYSRSMAFGCKPRKTRWSKPSKRRPLNGPATLQATDDQHRLVLVNVGLIGACRSCCCC